MKKLVLMLALATGLTMMATENVRPISMNPAHVKTLIGNAPKTVKSPLFDAQMKVENGVKKLPAMAEGNGFDIRFCGDFLQWVLAEERSRVDYKCFIEVTPDMATQAAGNVIESISFSTCMEFSEALGKEPKGCVFIAESLEADPVVVEECVLENGYTKYEAGKSVEQTVKLSTPYTIKEGQGFYFGYIAYNCLLSMTQQMADYPIGIDETSSGLFCGNVTTYDNETGKMIDDYTMEGADNLYLWATTTGPCEGFTDLFYYMGATVGYFALPVVKVGAQSVGEIHGFVQNYGSNDLTAIEYQLTVNGVDLPSEKATIDIKPLELGEFIVPMSALTPGTRNEIKLHVLSINGKALPENVVTSDAIVIDTNGYSRPMVVEEGTGTWCGWCPMGIVGLEYMTEKYGDDFIGIAVHYSDEFAENSYQPLIENYIDGFPSCIAGRDTYFIFQPEKSALEQVWKYYFKPTVAAAKVDLTVNNVKEDARRLEATADVTFDFDDSANEYRIAFVVLEDGLKATQQNYFSGSGESMDGWEDMPSTVVWTFTETARNIFEYDGIKDSLPKEIKKGETYSFDYTIKTGNVKKVSETSIVCMLIDQKTSTIMNAVKIPFSEYKGEAGISDIATDNSAASEAVYYNLNGMRVDSRNLTPGLYIVRTDKEAKKVIVK